jgi:hypothetical protein
VNRMTKRLACIESGCGAGNDRNAVGSLVGISVPHGTDTDDALADLGIVPEPRDLVLAFVELAPSAPDQRPALLLLAVPGIWNGFPLLYWDSVDYIKMPFDGIVPGGLFRCPRFIA